jgi:hypothetical protein
MLIELSNEFGIRLGDTLASSSRANDDAMIRGARKPMTVLQLKRSMDRRFDRAERSTRHEFDKGKSELVRSKRELRAEIAALRTELREEIRRSAEDTRRHMDVIAESLRDDLRIFADAIGLHSERLNTHDMRIGALERRTLPG